jgi:hypothetical protein
VRWSSTKPQSERVVVHIRTYNEEFGCGRNRLSDFAEFKREIDDGLLRYG